MLLVELDSFPNLKCLTYGTYVRDFVLPYAIRQLEAVASKCGIVQVTFDMRIDTTNDQLEADRCRAIDNLSSGEKFPFLKSVYLHRTIAFLFFPRLCSAGLLKVLATSAWTECVEVTT